MAVAARKKTKIEAANLPVPQSDVEASEAVARIGRLARELGRIEAELNDQVAALTTAAAAAAEPHQREYKELTKGLQIYCEANRERLTAAGRTKTVEFTTGKVAWRGRPPKVSLRGAVDEIIARLKTLGLTQFLRTKEEVDKEAMLKNPELARTVQGVSIASAGEDFVVEPMEAELAEVKS